MDFLKKFPKLRIIIMTVLFVAGLGLTFYGWSLTGQLLGLGLMLVGIVLLLTALFVYNKPYNDKK